MKFRKIAGSEASCFEQAYYQSIAHHELGCRAGCGGKIIRAGFLAYRSVYHIIRLKSKIGTRISDQ